MAEFKYYFYDISSKRLIDVLPMEGVAFGWELRGIGTLSGTIPMYADDLPAQRVVDAIHPYRTKIYVERGDQIIWGGWLHQEPSYDSTTGTVTITAEESLGYFTARTVPTVNYTQVDQLSIARSLVSTAQAESGGDFGMTLDPTYLSGVLRDRAYSQSDQTSVLSALTQLSEVTSGFDFGTQVGRIGANPYELLVFGYPRLGRVTYTSGVVFEYDRFSSGGGNVESYTWADAGTPMATRVWANSQTPDGVQLTLKSDNAGLVVNGYPIMEHSETFDNVTNIATLSSHAAAMSAYRAGPRITASITMKAQSGIQIGDFQIGDDALVRISDHRFPPSASGGPGFLGYLRIVGAAVQAGVEGEEQYKFTLADFITAI